MYEEELENKSCNVMNKERKEGMEGGRKEERREGRQEGRKKEVTGTQGNKSYNVMAWSLFHLLCIQHENRTP